MRTKPNGEPSNPKPQSEPEFTPQQKLQQELSNRDTCRQIAADPNQTPESAAAAASLARSWGAAALARQKALEPEGPGNPNTDPYLLNDPYLLRMLMPEQLATILLGSPSPNPPTSSPQSEKPSTRSETSTERRSARPRR